MTKRTRRTVLGLCGIGLASLAGCIGAGSSTDEPSTPEDGGHDDGGHDEGSDDGGHDEGSDDGGHGHGGSVGEPVEAAEVTMLSTESGEHFDPHVVRVTTGGTVTWHNESGSHSATAYHPDNDQPALVPEGAAAWDSGLLSEQGATFEHTFQTPGVYHYYCTPHESLGMIGSVIVGEPDAHEQPALGDPPADKPEPVREKLHELNEMCNQALGHGHEEESTATEGGHEE